MNLPKKNDFQFNNETYPPNLWHRVMGKKFARTFTTPPSNSKQPSVTNKLRKLIGVLAHYGKTGRKSTNIHPT